jgi:Pyridoxamine 5'-phosphate oxidase
VATWADVVRQAPELAGLVRGRFDAHGLGLLATLRRDGSPRLSGVEPLFTDTDVWMGMMPDSLKALDLLRDPRFALHSATTDKNVAEGDAKVAGRALAVAADDAATFGAFRDAFAAATGSPPPDGPFNLFRGDVHEVSILRPAGDHLDIDFWRERDGLHHVDRY